MPESPHLSDADRAIELAAELLARAYELQTSDERRQQAELDRMITHEEDKATLIEMTDQAFRTHTPARVADQLTHVLDVQGIPRFFSPVEQVMLRGFQSFGEYLPGVAVPLVKEKMRRETANVILPAEPDLLASHLRERQQQGVQMNVNLLGEAILGENEAKCRINECIEALRMDDVNCLSVKVSTVYSQVSPLARRHTTIKVADRMERLYRTAAHQTDPETGQPKFIYLDMEEYRDLHLTADALRETLDRPGMQDIRAGIALQAYIPDSYSVMNDLIEWSTRRVESGGQPITIRLVKGANMEMERVEASIGGHAQAPYQSKIETDANFKRMLRTLTHHASRGTVRVGVASHNLFDIALALIWSAGNKQTQFEMLEGMANHQRRAISERDTQMLLYAPACRRESFLNAIGYLIRRLDENTGKQNFLRHAYRLKVDSPEFTELAEGFRMSLGMIDTVNVQPRRKQNRNQPPCQPSVANHWSELVNEPDTDWSLPHNADWAEQILDRWRPLCDDDATTIPLTIGGETRQTVPEMEQSMDPSRHGVVVCRYRNATVDEARQAVDLAVRDTDHWRNQSIDHRHAILRRVAQVLRERRGELMGAMVAEAGKTVTQADPEVSEAIDFCEFYPLAVKHSQSYPTIATEPLGVVAVITPWNFPLAIPCGGIAAALATGNTVILKPASETVLVARLLCQAFWDAGVSHNTLQMIPCHSDVAEPVLVKNPSIDAVILTGGTATAKRMLSVRPELHLLAETGGKNATIVTAMADRDLATKHVIDSAFGHSGQKCSATSLLLLENEVFEDEDFRDALADAVRSLPVGSAWDLTSKVGPLIRPPNSDLARGLKTLEDDESWLVVPEHIVGNPNLYRPGVKWNVRVDGFFHRTELFGPVLGVMKFSRLEEAIDIVRRTGYGLTSGLESLDDREIELWKQSIHAGNLYINRPTTGAIVLRQPFGGVGLSGYGPGVKAGGPHYVLPLMKLTNGSPVSASPTLDLDLVVNPQLKQWIQGVSSAGKLTTAQVQTLVPSIASQEKAMAEEFSQQHDTVRLVGQDNVRRYRPLQSMVLRVTPLDSVEETITAIMAGIASKTRLTLSIHPEVASESKQLFESLADFVAGHLHPVEETDLQIADRIHDGLVERVRLLGQPTPNEEITRACANSFVTLINERPLADGRVECLRFMEEQSVSHDYHRYGNLGRRSTESRRPVL